MLFNYKNIIYYKNIKFWDTDFEDILLENTKIQLVFKCMNK
jgi:hypothetical protein